MLNTLKLLNPLVDENLLDKSLNDLALMYQLNPDSRIFATAYYKIVHLAIKESNKYFGLDSSDVASYCLEKLEYCLSTFELGHNFNTYFCTVFRNVLREKTEALNYKKRKCILESINDILTLGVEDTYNLLSVTLPKTLTELEYKYCVLLSEGYDNKTISNILGVSAMTLCNYRKSLRYKLSGL